MKKQVVDDFQEEIPLVKPSYIVDEANDTPVVDREARPYVPFQQPVFRTNNPLERYYRTEALSITLPSRGRWFGVEIPTTVNGEVGILPMTAGDELVLKNPDALLNGSAVEQVIRSCVPALAGIKTLPMCDVEAILLAVKAASYGDGLEYEDKCPNCGEVCVGAKSIRMLLESMTFLEDRYPVRITDEMVTYLRPITFDNQTRLSLATFDEAMKFQALSRREDVSEEEKRVFMDGTMARIRDLNTRMILDSIEKIVVPEGEVVDRHHIMGWLTNAPSGNIRTIEEALKVINNAGVVKSEEVTCGHCGHEWEMSITVDPSHFFG